jgi:dipeptidyl aminopeptidase/acylaminoacyl peptidase
MLRFTSLAVLSGFLGVLAACSPQEVVVDSSSGITITLADYQRAEQFLSGNANPLVTDRILRQYWQENDRLVYQKSVENGYETLIADLVTGSKTSLFDPINLANAIGEITGEAPDSRELELRDIEVNAALNNIRFSFNGDDYSLDTASFDLQQLQKDPADEFLSPDGARAAFIRDHNLWLRDTLSNDITQLTFDGQADYGYATNNAGWLRDDGPVLLWSPDSQKIATFRHDARNVGEMYLVTTEVGHSELDAWKYPLPGDEYIFMIERVVIHLDDQPRLVRLNMPPDPHRSTTADHIAGRGGKFLDVEWSADSDMLAFVSSSRDHKSATLRLADPETGEVRTVLNETVATYYEGGFRDANWRVLHDRNEFIWFSERDDWGHLYLHDLETGQLKRQLTQGSWPVLEVLQVDAAAGLVYFTAAGKEGGDPYYHYLYRLSLDGGEPELLTPEPAHHVIDWSDSAEYFVDTYSTPETPPVAVVRNAVGNLILPLEEADTSALVDAGWEAPESFVVKARDQLTDLYGLLYRPTHFDPALSYPVLNYLYPGPQSGSVGSRSFQPARRDKQAVAELGFIVVEVDAMGTPGRSKSFHDVYYGNMGDNGLPDQITTIRQLAAERPWMDLDRVGIWGHSGGGFASTGAILRYPEFYKVAVSGAGNHDNRNYEDDWGEKWQGLLETFPESDPVADGEDDENGEPRTNYDNQANQLLAENLQGKLLLAHGMLDDNVPPSNTLLVVQALIEAEKDFDLVVFPEARHGFGNGRYFMKKRWDYFVEHLLGVEPVADFRFGDSVN